MKGGIRAILGGLTLILAAALLRWVVSPIAEQIPDDHYREMLLDAEYRLRISHTEDWQEARIVAKRVDQTLATTGGVSILEGTMRWENPTGGIIFQSAGIYGVNRASRLNDPAYGDVTRSGQFYFPHHTRSGVYPIWDPSFIGQRSATFSHVETVSGLLVYVFKFQGAEMDETSGYSSLPDVPETYFVHTDGWGKYWVEPVSGTVIDYEENGDSYYISKEDGTKQGSVFTWQGRFTAETRAAQTELARALRRRFFTLDVIAPLCLLFLGLAWIVIGFWNLRASKGAEAGE
jgi:hypothetical protein